MIIRNILEEDWGNVTFLVEMTLEEYNDAIAQQTAKLKNKYFNQGFHAGESGEYE